MTAAINSQVLQPCDFMLNWQSIAEDSVDLAIIDPPYGATKHDWDRKVDLSVLSWILSRLLRRTGQVALFSSGSMLSEVENEFSKYFVRRYVEVWQKPSALVVHKDRPRPDIEFISVFHRIGLKKSERVYNHQEIGAEGSPYIRRNRDLSHANIATRKRSIDANESGLRHPSSVCAFPNRPAMSTEEKKYAKHPTQKPLDLIGRLITALSNPGDLVLDPFLGSGTTLLGCENLNRRGIGFEKTREYFDMAYFRLSRQLPYKIRLIMPQLQAKPTAIVNAFCEI